MSGKRRNQYAPVAEQVAFDPDNCDDITSEEVQGAIEEVCGAVATGATTSYAWGRNGNISSNTWLLANEVPSQRTGIPFGLNNGEIKSIWVGNQDVNTFDVTIYEHDGDKTNLTALVTVSVTAARSDEFDVTDFGTITLTKGKQLAARVTSGSAKRVTVYMVPKGNL